MRRAARPLLSLVVLRQVAVRQPRVVAVPRPRRVRVPLAARQPVREWWPQVLPVQLALRVLRARQVPPALVPLAVLAPQVHRVPLVRPVARRRSTAARAAPVVATVRSWPIS